MEFTMTRNRLLLGTLAATTLTAAGLMAGALVFGGGGAARTVAMESSIQVSTLGLEVSSKQARQLR
jgi:hypothetical protein